MYKEIIILSLAVALAALVTAGAIYFRCRRIRREEPPHRPRPARAGPPRPEAGTCAHREADLRAGADDPADGS